MTSNYRKISDNQELSDIFAISRHIEEKEILMLFTDVVYFFFRAHESIKMIGKVANCFQPSFSVDA